MAACWGLLWRIPPVFLEGHHQSSPSPSGIWHLNSPARPLIWCPIPLWYLFTPPETPPSPLPSDPTNIFCSWPQGSLSAPRLSRRPGHGWPPRWRVAVSDPGRYRRRLLRPHGGPWRPMGPEKAVLISAWVRYRPAGGQGNGGGNQRQRAATTGAAGDSFAVIKTMQLWFSCIRQ